MVKTLDPTITLDEFLTLPETKPAREYIDGQIIQKPMPRGKHSKIQSELCAFINAILQPQKIAIAFPELRCTFGEKSIVPDISIFTWARIPTDENGDIADNFDLAPDGMIEILSPAQSGTKLTKKNGRCLDFQTQIGWLINPHEKTVLVYTQQQLILLFDQPDQPLPVPEFATAIRLTVREIFNWLLK